MHTQTSAAIILAGGYGTRLRPLTYRMPKPMVPFLNVPMISYQIRALKRVGVDIIVVGVSRLAQCDQLMAYTNGLEKELGIKITYAIEDVPLDTGGACIEAFRTLTRYWAESGVSSTHSRRVILSFADVFCSDFELAYSSLSCDDEAMVQSNDVLMLATTVVDPSRYGVLLTDVPSQKSEPLRIRAFIEKPKTWCGNLINAGIFSIPTIMLEELCRSHPEAATPLSLERRIFVDWVESGQLCCMPLPKDIFWIDLGKPGDYLQATMHMMHDAQEKNREENVIGKDVAIAETASVCTSIIMDGVMIGDACVIKNSIIGPNVIIPDKSEWTNKVAALDTNCELVIQSIEK